MSNENNVDAMLDLVDEYMKEHLYKKAVNQCNKILKISPNNKDALEERGTSYYFLGCPDTFLNAIFFRKYYMPLAVKDLTAVINIDPTNGQAYYFRGSCFESIKKHNEALRDYNMALKLRPNNFLWFYCRGNLCHAMELYDNAVNDFTEAIRLEPTYTMAYYGRANALISKDGIGYAIENDKARFKRICSDLEKSGSSYAKHRLEHFNRLMQEHERNIK